MIGPLMADVPPTGQANSLPVFKAMLICDQAIREEGTGKTSLIGIFENIHARSFPARHSSLAVYAMMTDAQGDYTIRLDLVRLDDLMTIGRGQGPMTFEDRRKTTEITFTLTGLQFDGPGTYEFRLYADDRLVGHKAFRVLGLASPPPQQGAP
jgi:hypothetical protein